MTFSASVQFGGSSDPASFKFGLSKDGPEFDLRIGGGDDDEAAESRGPEEGRDAKTCGCDHEVGDKPEQLLEDVKSVKSSSAKRALIEAFVADALKGKGAEGKDGPEAQPSRTAGSEAPSGPSAAAPSGKPAEKGLEFKPLMKELGGLAEAVDKSKLPEKTQTKLLDGIAGLMSKLQDVQKNGGDLREAALKGVADLVQTLDGAKGSEKAKGALMDKMADTLVGIAKGKLGKGEEAQASPSQPSASQPKPQETSGSERPASPQPASTSRPSETGSASENNGVWTHSVKGDEAEIRLGDKYTITADETNATWTVKNNETGVSTKVHGDPHVDVGADGKDDWDFKKDMTFTLDDGTKISVGTVDAGNGTTFSSSLTITNGDNAIQVTGLGDDKDGKGNLKVVQSNAGETLDELTHDGFTIEEEGDSWIGSLSGSKIGQAQINEAEKAA